MFPIGGDLDSRWGCLYTSIPPNVMDVAYLVTRHSFLMIYLRYDLAVLGFPPAAAFWRRQGLAHRVCVSRPE